MSSAMYEELVKEVEYASKSHSIGLMHEALGKADMARRFGALSRDEYLHLSGVLICRNHLNNADWRKECEDTQSPKHT